MQKENESHPVTRLFDDPADGERASAPVAVLDSGVGGICVLRQLHRILPCEDLLYFGDSANAPYGEREEGKIYMLHAHSIEFTHPITNERICLSVPPKWRVV